MDFKKFNKRKHTVDIDNRKQIKAIDLVGETLTVRDFAIVKTKNGDSAIVLVDEYPEQFFFAGKVLTGLLSDIENAGCTEDLQNEGMKIVMSKAVGKKSGNEFYNVEIL